MGGLISRILSGKDFSALVNDFEPEKWHNPSPATPEEKELYDEACAALEKTPDLLDSLTNYKPCSDFIRQAMNDPDNEENEETAFVEVTKNAGIIATFWRFSKELESLVPRILMFLGKAEDEHYPVSEKTAVAKKLAEIFQFVLRFDELKMLRPGLQNDFSFYRRSLSKHAQDPDLEVRDDDASFISLFLAAHIPMMTALSKTVANAYNDDEDITQSIAVFANTMHMILKNKCFAAEDKANLLVVRAMVGAVILFDHTEPEGVFHKRSPVNIVGVCKMLQRTFPELYPSLKKDANLMGLVSAVKYSSMHFSDDSTPQNVTDILDS
jgi:hypothetical protein